MTATTDLDLRPVTQRDAAFLFELYASTRLDEFAAWGLPPGMSESLMRMQYECQQGSYAMQYPDARDRIVLYRGERVGRLLTAQDADDVVLILIALMPTHRGKGIGTALIQQLQDHAAREHRGLRLHVLAGSPAQNLYVRLGFRTDLDKPPYVGMRWGPSAPGVRAA